MAFSRIAFLRQPKLKCLHIHLLPYEFATRLVMKVHLPSLPGSVSCDGSFSLPPCAESPFAQTRCYLLWHDVLHHVRRHYPSFIAHTGSCARPKPSCFLQPQLGQQVFAGCRRPLLGKWPFPALSLQSLHGCLDPYPAAFPRCIYPFLPGEHRPHVRSETFDTPIYSHIATSVGHAFRGCSHSVMFRPPCSLDPQIAPTAVNYNSQGGRAVYTTQWTCGYPHELWYRYMPESGNWHGGTLTR